MNPYRSSRRLVGLAAVSVFAAFFPPGVASSARNHSAFATGLAREAQIVGVVSKSVIPSTLPPKGGTVLITAELENVDQCELALLSRQGFPVVNHDRGLHACRGHFSATVTIGANPTFVPRLITFVLDWAGGRDAGFVGFSITLQARPRPTTTTSTSASTSTTSTTTALTGTKYLVPAASRHARQLSIGDVPLLRAPARSAA